MMIITSLQLTSLRKFRLTAESILRSMTTRADPSTRSTDMDEDDNSWIPLSPASPDDSNAIHHDNIPQYENVSSANPSSRSKPSRRTSNIEQRLETRLNLKSNLVDHPIDLFWKRYLFNLAREVWALEWHLRLGLFMVLSGIVIKLFLLSTWYFWYPRFVIVAFTLVAATIYMDIFDLQRHLETVGNGLLNPEKILQILEHLDSTGLRRLTVVILLIPTALEMRTLSFLSGIKAETGWIVYNTFLSGGLMGLMMYWFRILRVQPRECLYRGLLVLYGSALWITIYRTDLSRMPVLAAPFLSATGTILITYQDDDMEWMSRVLRHALRLTLRDVLASIGGKVSEDEMLQLAILRWIADYWASAPDYTPAANAAGSSMGTPASAETNTNADTTSSTGVAASMATTPQIQSQSLSSSRRPSSIFERRHDVTWEELLPMLNVATDYMTSEVEMLQTNGKPEDSGPKSKNPSSNPVESFHDMLQGFSVDERAEPAVRAYKRAVESFPPSHHTAVLLSVMRRSPALLTILWHFIFFKPGLCTCILILLPFVAMEYQRIMCWIHSCEEVKHVFHSVEPTGYYPHVIPTALRDADPLVILLVGDSYNAARPPALLLVWQNVLSSVSALEVGLTAARCAETTAVAVQFAGNMLSLVQFGQEIHQHGILHGLLVMGKEAILYHTMDESMRNREAAKYTMAVMGAMDNAQRVARNVQMLANDDNVGHIFQPVVGLACALSGYGWLWGNERPVDETMEGTNGDPMSEDDSAPRSAATTGPHDVDDSTFGADKEQTINKVSSLSDLMDEIAESFAHNHITKEQKDELCEALLLCAEDSASTLDVVRKALVEFVEQNKDHPTDESTVNEKVTPSAAMEMVLAAYYRGLIDQSEKLAFCSIISSMRDGEQRDMAMGETMIRELTSILERGEPVEARKLAGTSGPPLLQGQGAEGHVSENPEKPVQNANDMIDSRLDSGSTTDDRDTTRSPLSLPNVTENLPQSSDQSTARPTGSAGESTASPLRDQNERRSHEAWLRFGTATLSVLVGGILMARNEEVDQQHRQEHGTSQSTEMGASGENDGSTVQIEELHEEAEEEWISVPQ